MNQVQDGVPALINRHISKWKKVSNLMLVAIFLLVKNFYESKAYLIRPYIAK